MTKKINNNNRVYIRLVSLVLILTIAAIFLVLHFALARVTIKIFSQEEIKQAKIIIPLRSEENLETSGEAILGKIITTELELESSVAAESTTTPADRASGYATIINNSAKDQTLVKTTRLLGKNGKIYRLSEQVTIPKGTKVEVWAEADQAGADYVLEPGHLTIPGLAISLQEKIYAENQDGFKLESLPTFMVSAENIVEAQKQTKKQAETKGLEIINSLLADNLKITTDNLFFKFDTIDTSYVGQNVKNATLKQRATIYGLVFSLLDLKEISESQFAKDLESNQSLLEFLPDSFRYQITEINPEKNEAVIEVNLKAKINSSTRTWSIDKDRLVGLDDVQIKKYLQDELGIEKVEIKFFPFWVHTAPSIKDHIIIE